MGIYSNRIVLIFIIIKELVSETKENCGTEVQFIISFGLFMRFADKKNTEYQQICILNVGF